MGGDCTELAISLLCYAPASFEGRWQACSCANRRAAAAGDDRLVVRDDPRVERAVVVADLLGLEPHGDLVLGRVGSVGSVDEVAARGDAVVSAQRAGRGLVGVGGAEDFAAREDHVRALPDHADDGARGKVLDEPREEGARGQVGVVGLGALLGRRHELERHQLVALLLEARDHLADESALHAVGLDGDERALLGRAGHARVGRRGRSLVLRGLALRRGRERQRHGAGGGGHGHGGRALGADGSRLRRVQRARGAGLGGGGHAAGHAGEHGALWGGRSGAAGLARELAEGRMSSSATRRPQDPREDRKSCGERTSARPANPRPRCLQPANHRPRYL